ncbi:MAG: hypothetical protein HRT61_00835 [Ekhidna sp.]|nr:hypothetical protein [Ekhidna sp.]
MPKIEVTSNFLHNSKAFQNRKRYSGVTTISGRYNVIAHEGSSRSGKSWAIAQFIVEYIMRYTGKTITIARDSKAALKDTTYHTLRKVFGSYGLSPEYFNKSATDIHIRGNIIRFVGCNEDPLRAHGLEQDLLWINEAIAVPKLTYDQMVQRTNEFVFVDFNPSEVESYLYDLEMQDNVYYVNSTFVDNPAAPRAEIDKILSYAHPKAEEPEGYWKKVRFYHPEFKSHEDWERFKAKNLEQNSADLWMWRVYGLGERTVGDDRVIKKYEIFYDYPEVYDSKMYGGDFGFSPAPAAGIERILNGNKVYLTELMYEHYTQNEDIAEHLKPYLEEIWVWDEAGKKDIARLRQLGMNAYPCDKRGGVESGIRKMQSREIFIHYKSENLLNEVRNYRWKKTKSGDYVINSKGHRSVVKTDDHLLDAWRYVETLYI